MWLCLSAPMADSIYAFMTVVKRSPNNNGLQRFELEVLVLVLVLEAAYYYKHDEEPHRRSRRADLDQARFELTLIGGEVKLNSIKVKWVA